ncbi:MAG TPA: 3-phytase [Bacteroidales bacterium]|nr:3-phytase [Bacteroidales bacterium]
MKIIRVSVVAFAVLTLLSCKHKVIDNKQAIEKYCETLDSSGFSVYLANAIENQKIFDIVITADIETDEVVSQQGVDAADDPAIWVNTDDPEKSLILGTNKKGGIHVYNMDGKELQFLKAGCINNIDLRDDFNYNGKDVVLVAATNCTLNTISLFYIDKSTLRLSDTILNIKSSVDLVYGLCMYKSAFSNKFFVFVNGEGADVEQWEISYNNGSLNSELVRTFKVSSRPEGMVADDIDGILYLGVEEEGILKIKAEPEFEFETVWVKGSNPSEESLVSSDIEGLALYKTDRKTYLIASSQGNFSYPVFEIGNPDKYLFSFVIDDDEIDGVIETDGIEITNFPLNSKFPKGMLVLQDGYNFSGDTLRNQNFKYVSWEKIEALIQIH